MPSWPALLGGELLLVSFCWMFVVLMLVLVLLQVQLLWMHVLVLVLVQPPTGCG